jgi:hypothetical protein
MALSGEMGISGIIELCERVPIGRVGRRVYQGPYLQVVRKAEVGQIHKVDLIVKNKYYENYPTARLVLLSSSLRSSILIRCILTSDATTENAFLVWAIFWMTVINS